MLAPPPLSLYVTAGGCLLLMLMMMMILFRNRTTNWLNRWGWWYTIYNGGVSINRRKDQIPWILRFSFFVTHRHSTTSIWKLNLSISLWAERRRREARCDKCVWKQSNFEIWSVLVFIGSWHLVHKQPSQNTGVLFLKIRFWKIHFLERIFERYT